MNTSQLKSYAPEARKAFIEAVSAQAARLGISAKKIARTEVRGDVLLVEGKALPKSTAEPRRRLVDRLQNQGFGPTMEAVAYTWFNRFVAIRYMELHGYLDHGYRVLSHPEGLGRPEILDHATEVELPGLDPERVVELKLDGTKDEDLFRLLLKAQCNALHEAMPFLFERIGDETELLLPANLLHTDSLIRKLVEEIDEEAWEQIEIIGWLYQFYISEKKDEVIGKVVKSEDIPAATQLFTPNWIVKYMVQNSLGAQWLATYPNSPLKSQMEYYIHPAEQTEGVQAQLDVITPDSLDPEKLTLIDPACGSGHILVEAYDLFKAIYLERGYRQRDVAKLILEKNLFGLEISERAAQLTGFALMMKGRADDRRIFDRGVKLNVLAFQNSDELDPERLAEGMELPEYGLRKSNLTEIKELFKHATTFGSLIQVPEALAKKLPALKKLSEANGHDVFVVDAMERLGPLVRQAEFLAAKYDAVVTNPPYMGSKSYCGSLKEFVNDTYKAGKTDLYGAFTLRNIQFAKKNARIGMITIPNWMFLSSFEQLRGAIFETAPISSLVHNGRGVWGSDFGSCSYVLHRSSRQNLRGRFLRLFDKQGGVASNEELKRRFHANTRFTASNREFRQIPGSPVAYWASKHVRSCFLKHPPLGDSIDTREGLTTGNNETFLRLWWEVDHTGIAPAVHKSVNDHPQASRWYLYTKGGEFRRWSGNVLHIVDWENDGARMKAFADPNTGRIRSHNYNGEYAFRPGFTWSGISIALFAVRNVPGGHMFDAKGPMGFAKYGNETFFAQGLLNSKVVMHLIKMMAPTLDFKLGHVLNLPFTRVGRADQLVQQCIALSEPDWNAYERSWDFQSLPILAASSEPTPTFESSYTAWITRNRETIAEMKRLEEENNRLFIEAYGLQDELTPDVPVEQITLTVNPAYRYGTKLTDEKQWTRFRQDTVQELVSYAVGCVMGRYSLDEPGLIYAHSGNEDFHPDRYTTFPADDDGIIPVTDTDWFPDDAVHRLVEFLSVAWDPEHLEENLTFLADNLSPRKNEASRETVRRYLCDSFFKDHLQTYKKRPIYWLFSSGKQKAFQCLVYLHRYHEGTLARMRSEYVIPLQGKMAARIEQLAGDIEGATSAAHRKRLEKERDKLEKQQVELLAFDEKLRHYADKRIRLDLDDGVKVNYGKFGNLLAEVKKVHGKLPQTS